jgi:hypothetical protein
MVLGARILLANSMCTKSKAGGKTDFSNTVSHDQYSPSAFSILKWLICGMVLKTNCDHPDERLYFLMECQTYSAITFTSSLQGALCVYSIHYNLVQ